MSQSKSRSVFINLAVKDLEATKTFFSALGFAFNPQFTDENATCMILSEQGYVMFLVKPFFKGFTKKAICDSEKSTETMLALGCESRAEVDALVDLALKNGGRFATPPQDHGFMYGRSFYDLDGHHWEAFWMDTTQAPPTPGAA